MPRGNLPKSSSSGSRGRSLKSLRSVEGSSDDDADSVHSFRTAGSNNAMGLDPALSGAPSTAHSSTDSLDALQIAERNLILEFLGTDKRKSSASQREATLERLNSMLSRSYLPELYASSLEDMVDSLCKIARRERAAKAVRALALLSLNMPEDFPLDTADAALRPLIRDKECDAIFRQHCLDGIAQLYILSAKGADGSACLSMMEAIQTTYFGRVGDSDSSLAADSSHNDLHPSIVLDAAVRTWAAIFSLGNVELEEEDIDHLCESFLELLNNANLEVRVSTGEAIALLFESYPRRDFLYSRELEQRTMELSNFSAKSTAKRDRAVQRRSFKDVVATITSKGVDVPSESLKVKSDEIRFKGWRRIIMLQSIKSLVGESLNVHLVQNERLQEIFGFPPISEEVAKLTAYERQLSRKMRTLNMSSDRLTKKG